MQQRKIGPKKIRAVKIDGLANLQKQSSVASQSRERQGSLNNGGRIQISLDHQLINVQDGGSEQYKFKFNTQGASTKNNEQKKIKFVKAQQPPPSIISPGQHRFQDDMSSQPIQLMSVKNQSLNSHEEGLQQEIQFQSQLTAKAASKGDDKLIPKKKIFTGIRTGKSSQAESRGQQMQFQKQKIVTQVVDANPQHVKPRKASIHGSRKKMKNMQQTTQQSALTSHNSNFPRNLADGIYYDPGRGLQTTTNAMNPKMYQMTTGATVQDLNDDQSNMLNNTYNFNRQHLAFGAFENTNSSGIRKPNYTFIGEHDMSHQQIDRSANMTNLISQQEQSKKLQMKNWQPQTQKGPKPINTSTKTLMVSSNPHAQIHSAADQSTFSEHGSLGRQNSKPQKKQVQLPKKKNSQQTTNPILIQKIQNLQGPQQMTIQKKGNSPAVRNMDPIKQQQISHFSTRNPNITQQVGHQLNYHSIGPNKLDERGVVSGQGKIIQDFRVNDMHSAMYTSNAKKPIIHFPSHGPASVKNERGKLINFETNSNGAQDPNPMFSQTGPIPKEVLPRDEYQQRSSEMGKKGLEKVSSGMGRQQFIQRAAPMASKKVIQQKKNQSPLQPKFKANNLQLTYQNNTANPKPVIQKATLGGRGKPSSLLLKPQSPQREKPIAFQKRSQFIQQHNDENVQFSVPSQPSLPRKAYKFVPQNEEDHYHQQQQPIQVIQNYIPGQKIENDNKQKLVNIQNQQNKNGQNLEILNLNHIVNQYNYIIKDGKKSPRSYGRSSSSSHNPPMHQKQQTPLKPHPPKLDGKTCAVPKTHNQTPKNNTEIIMHNINQLKSKLQGPKQKESRVVKKQLNQTQQINNRFKENPSQMVDDNHLAETYNESQLHWQIEQMQMEVRQKQQQLGQLSPHQREEEETYNLLQKPNNSRQNGNIFFHPQVQKSFDDQHVQSVDAQSYKAGSQLRPSSQKRKSKVVKQQQQMPKQFIRRGRGSSAGSKDGKNVRGQKSMMKVDGRGLKIDPNIEIPVKELKKPVTVTHNVNGIMVGGQDIFSFPSNLQQKMSPKQVSSTPFAAGKKQDDGNFSGSHEQHGTFTLTKINEKFKHSGGQNTAAQRSEIFANGQKSPKNQNVKKQQSPSQKFPVNLEIQTTVYPVASHPEQFFTKPKPQGFNRQTAQQTQPIPIMKKQDTPKQVKSSHPQFEKQLQPNRSDQQATKVPGSQQYLQFHPQKDSHYDTQNISSEKQTQNSQSYTAIDQFHQPMKSYETINQNSGTLKDPIYNYNGQIDIIEYDSSGQAGDNSDNNAPIDNNGLLRSESIQPISQQSSNPFSMAQQSQEVSLQASHPSHPSNTVHQLMYQNSQQQVEQKGRIAGPERQQHSQKQQPQLIQKQQKSSDVLELPNTGARVLRYFLKRPGLTEYEKTEILDYRQVFFLGLDANKIKGSRQNQYNFGYDDQRGDFKVVLKDQIDFRYEVLEFLGKGSFGQALKCKDHKTGEIVAIKIIRNKKSLQHQAGVELNILLHLKNNDPDDTNNIIRIKDYCMFRRHLVISFELFSINLYEFIKSNNFEGVSLNLIRRFAIQILQSLKYLKEENLIHCDLKPENILLKSPDKSGIKVIDFGSSCFADQKIYTYIQSRFYRAPEVILGIPYTSAIDMWSFGCILAELFTGVPIFPGESEQEQLTLIMEVLGLPADQILMQGQRKDEFFNPETNEPYLTTDSQNQLRIPGQKPLEEVLNCDSESFLDFIRRCLEWDPTKRISPLEALMHTWIIEGLPHQVLIHHRNMLGIPDTESETQNQSMVDDVGGEEFQGMTNNTTHTSNELPELDQMENFHHQIDSHDLSNSQIQIMADQPMNQRDSIHIEEQSLDDQVIRQGLQRDNDNIYHGSQYLNEVNQIDFYGQASNEYQNHQFLENEHCESVVNPDEVELEEATHFAQGWMAHEAKADSRAGAKQNNFNKTGKNFFPHMQQEQPQPKAHHRMFQEEVKASKSEMGRDDENIQHQQEMVLNLNMPMISNIRGMAFQGEGKKHLNLLEVGQMDKHKTANISEILSQINKKSKSTKHTVHDHEDAKRLMKPHDFGKRNSFFKK